MFTRPCQDIPSRCTLIAWLSLYFPEDPAVMSLVDESLLAEELLEVDNLPCS
jgi:hypothetical protein